MVDRHSVDDGSLWGQGVVKEVTVGQGKLLDVVRAGTAKGVLVRVQRHGTHAVCVCAGVMQSVRACVYTGVRHCVHHSRATQSGVCVLKKKVQHLGTHTPCGRRESGYMQHITCTHGSE